MAVFSVAGCSTSLEPKRICLAVSPRAMSTGAPFTLPYFQLWVWVGIAWGFISTVIITGLPLLESADAIKKVLSLPW